MSATRRRIFAAPSLNAANENLILVVALCGVEKWILRKVGWKYLKSFEMWCWRRVEKVSWTDRVRKEVFQRVKEQRNLLHRKERSLTGMVTFCVETAF